MCPQHVLWWEQAVQESWNKPKIQEVSPCDLFENMRTHRAPSISAANISRLSLCSSKPLLLYVSVTSCWSISSVPLHHPGLHLWPQIIAHHFPLCLFDHVWGSDVVGSWKSNYNRVLLLQYKCQTWVVWLKYLKFKKMYLSDFGPRPIC